MAARKLDSSTAAYMSKLPQDNRMNYLYKLLEDNLEEDLDRRLVYKVINGRSPENIYDVSPDVLKGDILTMYNKYNLIKINDGIAKTVKCKKCGKLINITYSKLMRMKSMAIKHGDTSIISTCDECKNDKKGKKEMKKEKTKPKAKKPATVKKGTKKKPEEKLVKAEVKIQNSKENLNKRVYPNSAKIPPTSTPICMEDVLADALKEVGASRTAGIKRPSRKVSIHEEITPMHGNSLGNLLKDIKI